MPSQRFQNQRILLSVALNGCWFALAASGEFVLPYLRAEHTFTGLLPHLNERLSAGLIADPSRPETAEDTVTFLEWVGCVYVEFLNPDDLIANPTRVEFSGTIQPIATRDVGPYFAMPPAPHTGLM